MSTDQPSPTPPKGPDERPPGGPYLVGLAFVGVVTFAWGAVCGGLLAWMVM